MLSTDKRIVIEGYTFKIHSRAHLQAERPLLQRRGQLKHGEGERKAAGLEKRFSQIALDRQG